MYIYVHFGRYGEKELQTAKRKLSPPLPFLLPLILNAERAQNESHLLLVYTSYTGQTL